MKYALNLADDGRVLSATYENFAADGMPIVEELPEGNISDYRYEGGEYVYDPLNDGKDRIIAPRNITTGEYVTVNGALYKAIANIPNGEAIVVGQNAIVTTVEDQLYELTKGE